MMTLTTLTAFGKVFTLKHYSESKLFHTFILLILYFLVFQMNIYLNVYVCYI